MDKAFTVVFSDDYLLIINKIARIVVQPAPGGNKRTLTSLLRKYSGKRIYPCHRLDKNTQGVMVYAKSSQAGRNISAQFKKKEVVKKYFALTQGNFKKDKGIFRSKILDRQGRQFGERPKKGETFYKVIKSCPGFDFLEVIPATGRTNQIRIHLARAGHPVLGEKKYAFRRDFMIKFNKLALCAYYLELRHPASGEKIVASIDIPEYIQNLIRR